jgi:hypothetical protein
MGGRWWKVIGLAGLAGVAATGVVVARGERERRAYTPEQVRSRLQERYAQSQAPASGKAQAPAPEKAREKDRG